MKKVIFISAFLLILASTIVLAQETTTASCNLKTSLINQDPYPAVPGEIVKLIFQVRGVESPGCGNVQVTFLETFPFTLDPESDSLKAIRSGTFVQDFNSYLLVPYKVRVDADAISGDNLVRIQVSSSIGTTSERFKVNVEDLRTDFEVSINNYDRTTNTLTFEILNTGEHDVEALTIDIPKQENIEIKGSTRNIVGSLDSNDDTTFNFEALPQDGEIKLIVLYTDEINERRTLEKVVTYDSIYFKDRAGDSRNVPFGVYVGTVLVILGIFYFWRVRRKNKKKKHLDSTHT